MQWLMKSYFVRSSSGLCTMDFWGIRGCGLFSTHLGFRGCCLWVEEINCQNRDCSS